MTSPRLRIVAMPALALLVASCAFAPPKVAPPHLQPEAPLAGLPVLVTIGDESGRFAVRALPSLPPGTAGVPIGLPMTPWLTIPSPARIHKAQAAP